MRFMTPASVENLPRYEAEDSRRLLMAREEAEKETARQEKKLFVQFGAEIQDAADNAKDPDSLNKALGAIRGKYKSMGMTPEMMQMGVNLSRQFKQDFLANQDRQERKDDRNMLLADKNLAKSDVNLLGQIASGKYKSFGADGYEVPGSEEAARAGLTGEGQLRLIDLLNKQDDTAFKKKEQGWKEADRPQQARLLDAQISKALRNDDDIQVVQDNEGRVSLVNKRTGEVKKTDAMGKTPSRDFSQAKSLIDIHEKAADKILKPYDTGVGDPVLELETAAKSGKNKKAEQDYIEYQQHSQTAKALTDKITGGTKEQAQEVSNQNNLPGDVKKRPPLSSFGTGNKKTVATEPKPQLTEEEKKAQTAELIKRNASQSQENLLQKLSQARDLWERLRKVGNRPE